MLVLISAYTIIALIQIPGLVKNKYWRELIVFSIIYVIAFAIGFLFVMDIPIPSPMRALHFLISEKMGLKYPES